MSTKTEWEIEVDMVVIDQNISVFINATAEGLKVDDLIIPWAEIDAARAMLAEDGDSIPAEMLRQIKENKPLSEKGKRIQSIKNEMMQEALKIVDDKVPPEWGVGTYGTEAYKAEQIAKNQEMRKLLDANPFAKI